MKTNTSISSLNLAGSHINDEQGEILGEALAQNTHLKTLNLDKSHFQSGISLRNICDGLKSNCTLLNLNLSNQLI